MLPPIFIGGACSLGKCLPLIGSSMGRLKHAAAPAKGDFPAIRGSVDRVGGAMSTSNMGFADTHSVTTLHPLRYRIGCTYRTHAMW